MRAMRFVCASTVAAGLLVVGPSPASAQDAQVLRQELDQLRRDCEPVKQQYGDRLSALEAKLALAAPTVEAPPGTPPGAPAQPTAQVPPGAEGAGGPSGALPVYGGSVAASKAFNPDMAVLGRFLWGRGQNDGDARPFVPAGLP